MVDRARVGRTLVSGLLQEGYERLDDEDSFVLRRALSPEANLIVTLGPYRSRSVDGVQVDVVLGLQFIELQRTWNRLVGHQPEEPQASWSVMTSAAGIWCPESERSAWFCTTESEAARLAPRIASAIRTFGLPHCDGLELMAALPAALARDDHAGWNCDRIYLLPLALLMVGRGDEAWQQADSALRELEAAVRKPNPQYLDGYRRFVGAVKALSGRARDGCH